MHRKITTWLIINRHLGYPKASYIDALLPDLTRKRTSKALLSVLLRPEVPPLGRPILLCASNEVVPDGNFDAGLIVTFECDPGKCGRALLFSKLYLELDEDPPEGGLGGSISVIGASPSERDISAALDPSDERFCWA